MTNKLRVGIVAHRFACLGGIQTLILELVAGLNELGIVPEFVWDEPQDWHVLGDPDVKAAYGGGRLGISSKTLRALPASLERRFRPLSLRHAKLGLESCDFVYSFEPGVKMPKGVPNLCWVAGPGFVRLPGDRVELSGIHRPGTIKLLLSHLTNPLTRVDKNSRYVTHSEFIADLIEDRCGFRPPVIWPPARSRTLPPAPPDRGGFLFLSRFEAFKRADSVLNLARSLPRQSFTLAGAVIGADLEYLARLRRRIADEGLANVTIVENPSEANVAGLLVAHDLFVFPAMWEHFGIVTVEAILAGCLPLVHDTGGQREIVPFDFLRFRTDEDLVDRAGRALKMSAGDRQQLVRKLQAHAQRGTPAHYRQVMLREVRDLPGRAVWPGPGSAAGL